MKFPTTSDQFCFQRYLTSLSSKILTFHAIFTSVFIIQRQIYKKKKQFVKGRVQKPRTQHNSINPCLLQKFWDKSLTPMCKIKFPMLHSGNFGLCKSTPEISQISLIAIAGLIYYDPLPFLVSERAPHTLSYSHGINQY